MNDNANDRDPFLYRLLARHFDGDDVDQLERLKFIYVLLAAVLFGIGIYLTVNGNSEGIWMILGAAPCVVLYWVVRRVYRKRTDIKSNRKSLGYD